MRIHTWYIYIARARTKPVQNNRGIDRRCGASQPTPTPLTCEAVADYTWTLGRSRTTASTAMARITHLRPALPPSPTLLIVLVQYYYIVVTVPGIRFSIVDYFLCYGGSYLLVSLWFISTLTNNLVASNIHFPTSTRFGVVWGFSCPYG